MLSAVHDNFECYRMGKPFYSPAPQELDRLPAGIMNELEKWTLDVPYGLGVTEERKSELYALQPALQLASQIISFSANDYDPELRLGMFSAAMQKKKIYDTELHIDDGLPTDFILCVVGKPTAVWTGSAVRLKKHPSGFKNRVKPLEGELRSLKPGCIYRLAPTTAHAEPPAPEEPQMRYFWRRRAAII